MGGHLYQLILVDNPSSVLATDNPQPRGCGQWVVSQAELLLDVLHVTCDEITTGIVNTWYLQWRREQMFEWE